jgi:hypothetical protein
LVSAGKALIKSLLNRHRNMKFECSQFAGCECKNILIKNKLNHVPCRPALEVDNLLNALNFTLIYLKVANL